MLHFSLGSRHFHFFVKPSKVMSRLNLTDQNAANVQGRRRRTVWIIVGAVIAACFLGFAALVLYAIFGPQSHNDNLAQTQLTQQSFSDLDTLPFCDVSSTLGIPAEVLAGVVLAEKQLNRDLTDAIQDSIANILLVTQNDEWWDSWAATSQAAARADEQKRLDSSDWSSNVAQTGFVFSLGPAQITTRTAISACATTEYRYEVCTHGVKHLVSSMMDPVKSLDVSAVVLVAEREKHLLVTGKDISDKPGTWAALYNYGGDIYRHYFGSNDEKLNRFSQWVADRSTEISSNLNCPN